MATLRFVDKSLSVFVGNLSTVVPHEEVEEVIYELFLQVSLFQKEGTLDPYFASGIVFFRLTPVPSFYPRGTLVYKRARF